MGFSFTSRAGARLLDGIARPGVSTAALLFAAASGGGLVAYADSAAESAPEPSQDAPKKKVLVLGTGWAGTSFLKNLDCSRYEVKVISPRNYFAFTPLLPSVTCGTVEARSIVEPIRRILEKIYIHEATNCIIYHVIFSVFLYHDMASHPESQEVEDAQKIRRFDKKIAAFAEQKFQRNGIEVCTGFRVIKVSDDLITMKSKSAGKEVSVPYGMAVWSAGIGTRPVIMDFMQQIGQTNRRALATNEWLRVRECEGVYAIGDCATVSQRKIMDDISMVFKMADKDNSGTLTLKEINDVLEDIYIRYPQVELYMKSMHMLDIADLIKGLIGDSHKESMVVDIEEFKQALSHVDSQVKMLQQQLRSLHNKGSISLKVSTKWKNAKRNQKALYDDRGSGRHFFPPISLQAFWAIRTPGWRTSCCRAPGRLGLHGPQHSVAVVLCVCQMDGRMEGSQHVKQLWKKEAPFLAFTVAPLEHGIRFLPRESNHFT
ncbi:unnamed protein product [Miscanthus lutarioriparius]|uniref:EF-hand domain-containing protein n=1 Tax=Miscanthus lutarioriparius TaxID=422564 RepID=A0A811S0B7_9POAL|nr:unnamed protein product [Miscanthus lutarioriparius]